MGTQKRITVEPGVEKLIVMPFRPGPGQAQDGKGLGLHFLAGNLICLHRDLLECWFGWRVKTIFPEKEALLSYCRGESPDQKIPALGRQEKVRFWLEGDYTGDRAGGRLGLKLWDTLEDQAPETELAWSHEDRFAGFYTAFFDWLDQTGLGSVGLRAGAWPESISARGLFALGSALETLYTGYVGGGKADTDLTFFKAAVSESPDSYLAQDLLGWGLYKTNDLTGAIEAFNAALAINPDGVGAHAGRMWIALAQADRDTALYHALEKGRCRGQAPEKARAFVARKLG